MLSASDLSLSFGDQQVLQDVNLTIDLGTRAGLIGANGSGKTTLLRILAGRDQPEAGTVIQAKKTTVEYLPQRNTVPLDTAVFAYAEGGYAAEHSLLAERESAAEILASDPDDESALHLVAEIDHHLEDVGYYERNGRIGHVLNGLGFSPSDYHRPLKEFSGGWRMRVALAKSLLTRPDILLLDEPTNYLDSEARMWLSEFLRKFPGGFVLVSHDRVFLDDTVDTIFELFSGRVKRYRGTFSEYESQRKAELEQLVAAWEGQQKEIQRQEEFIRRFRATASKAKQVQSRVKALEKLEPLEIPEHLRPISITLPPPVHSGKRVLTLTEVNKSYGALHVIQDLDLSLQKGQRLAVVGLNGAGKSTLLRLLSGREHPDGGSIQVGTGVKIAYFAQDSSDHLPSNKTILDYVSEHATDAARPRVRDLLGSFLFSGDNVHKNLGVLSGGERSRVAIATLLVRPANLLIMDEPTNHLDMTSQEVLSRALAQYEGTVVVVSHDRHFLRSIGTDVLALWPAERRGPQVPPKRWQLYPGSYREFESTRLGAVFLQDEQSNGGGDSPSPQRSSSPQQNDYQQQKALKSALRRLERREQEILEAIDALERDHRSLQAELSAPENYRDGQRVQELQEQIRANEERSSHLHAEWEEIESKRSSLQPE